MADTYRNTANNENLAGPGQYHGHDPSSTLDRSPNDTLEKDFSNGAYHMDHRTDSDTALRRIRTAGSISISPELFEKLYLSPQNKVAGELRKTFGNPTPIALTGFLLSLTPLSCQLMGWRGAGGNGASDTAAYIFFGGILMLVGGFLEWIIGNTFPCVVFMSFGAFWLTFAGTLMPFYNAYGAYSPNPSSPAEGLETVGFNASFAFLQLFMAVLCLVYLVCALRTNLVFVFIFFLLVPAFSCLSGAYFHLGSAYSGLNVAANTAAAGKLVVAAGAFCFVTCLLGWWIFAAIMLASLDFPFQIPVGDLSGLIKGASEKAKEKEERYSV